MFKQLIIAGLLFGSTISLLAQTTMRPISAKDTITDKDLVIPEQIEKNFDQLLIDWKRDMKPSNLCTSNYDTNVAYPDTAYINRLYRLPTMMELVYNPIVRSYIDMYTGRMRNSVEYFLGKSHYYFPIFEQALDKYGLPLELKYLPIIESALNPTIVSRAGATGLWQFMVGTGKMYDLEINSLVDERRDPLRSTEAAARYLRDLFNIYGDWNLVIAAYNCGPGNVNKAIKRSGGQTDYWAIYQYLPRETRGYVPAFIAATYVMNYSELHNICPFEYKYNHSTDTITVDKYVHFRQLADVLDVPIDEVRSLNPQFKNDIIPGEFKRYTVTLPSASAANFGVQKDLVYSYRTNEFLVHRKVVEPAGGSTVTTKIRYKVRKGESLASIASKHGVTTKQIRRWNRLKSNKVRTGQILAINKTVRKPKPTTTESTDNQYYAENTTSSNTDNNVSGYSREMQDERDAAAPSMLAEYFSRYSTGNKTQDSSPANETAQVNTTNIEEESEDEEAAAREETRSPDETQTIYHKVRIGETVSLIASKYNVEKNDIAKWNKLKSAVPKIGQRLVIHLPVQPEKTKEEEIIDEVLPANVNRETLLASNSGSNTSASNKVVYKEYGPSSSVTPLAEVERKPVQEVKTTPKATPKSKPKQKKAKVYTVKKGDTLSKILNKMGSRMSTKDIMRANNLRSDKLKIGQKLKIPR
ncbi:LysM peptidoglycan-binding domain-containing protein [Dysgonomonas sp. OttesenSCG-928-M03]|nr:LysM peptidoglycan-binding domain-containing protein [Dysgonomonas sp. OttesenSCG-928-M03]